MNLRVLLCAIGAAACLNAAAQDDASRSIEIGPYTHPAGDDGEDGSVWEKAPVNLTYVYSGSQFIYDAEMLRAVADDKGEITDLSFIFADRSAVYLSDIKITLFAENYDETLFQETFPGSGIYTWYTYDPSGSKCELETEAELYYYEDLVLDFKLDKPLKYEGKSLLVTVRCSRSAESGDPYMFPFVERTYAPTTMVYGSDKVPFDIVYDRGEQEPYQGPMQWVPAVKVTYTPGTDSLTGIMTDSDEAAEYFNLQGIRVTGTPAPGVYIRRSGDKAVKVSIR